MPKRPSSAPQRPPPPNPSRIAQAARWPALGLRPHGQPAGSILGRPGRLARPAARQRVGRGGAGGQIERIAPPAGGERPNPARYHTGWDFCSETFRPPDLPSTMPTPLSRTERETIIVFNDGDPLATITTNSPVIARRLAKRLGESQGKYKGPETWEWEVPKAWVTLPRSKSQRKSLGNPGALAAYRSGLAKKPSLTPFD